MKKHGLEVIVFLSVLFLLLMPAVHADIIPEFLKNILKQLFAGNLFQQEWAGRSIFALLVFTMLFWAAGFIFKNAGGVRFTVALILSIISGIGVPKAFISTMLTTYGFVSGIIVILLPIFALFYLQRFFPDTRMGQLGRIAMYLLIFVLLTYVANTLALDSSLIKFSSKYSFKFKDAFAIVQLVIFLMIMRAVLKLFTGAGAGSGGYGFGTGHGSGLAGIRNRVRNDPLIGGLGGEVGTLEVGTSPLAREEARELGREERAGEQEEVEDKHELDLTSGELPQETREIEKADKAEDAALAEAAAATAKGTITAPDLETLKKDFKELQEFSKVLNDWLKKLTDSMIRLEKFETEEYMKTFKTAQSALNEYAQVRKISGKKLEKGDSAFQKLKMYRKKIGDELGLKIQETKEGLERDLHLLVGKEEEFRKALLEAGTSLKQSPPDIPRAHALFEKARQLKHEQEAYLKELELWEKKISEIEKHEFSDLENEEKVAELLKKSGKMRLE
ncbi:MAG: hypothetical protein V1743_03745 [Nanoarchaeota archaeon]